MFGVTVLSISTDQIERLGQTRRVNQWLDLLSQAYPDQFPEDTPELRQTLQAVAQRARSHAILHDRDVGRFICLAYALGETFDSRFPAAQAILADATRPAADRLILLEFWADELVRALDGVG